MGRTPISHRGLGDPAKYPLENARYTDMCMQVLSQDCRAEWNLCLLARRRVSDSLCAGGWFFDIATPHHAAHSTPTLPHRGLNARNPDICPGSIYFPETYRSPHENRRFRTHILTLNPAPRWGVQRVLRAFQRFILAGLGGQLIAPDALGLHPRCGDAA